MSVADTLHKLREQLARLEADAEEMRSLKALKPELEKLRQKILDLGETPCA